MLSQSFDAIMDIHNIIYTVVIVDREVVQALKVKLKGLEH